MKLKIDLERMSEAEVRSKLCEYGYELPSGFNFFQHISIMFDTELGRVVAVEKWPFSCEESIDKLKKKMGTADKEWVSFGKSLEKADSDFLTERVDVFDAQLEIEEDEIDRELVNKRINSPEIDVDLDEL
ncbi:hypothetical protein [Vibrio sp. F74]|uniref:hypothetical protein n=1 Tax=Vibrio sp. F74 TaxID=700020 RepID=UPI0035F5982D